MTPHFSKYSTIHKTKTFVTFNFARIPQIVADEPIKNMKILKTTVTSLLIL